MNPTVFSSPEPNDEVAPAEPPMMVGNPTLMRRNQFNKRASVRTITPIVLFALLVAGFVAAVTYHRARPARPAGGLGGAVARRSLGGRQPRRSDALADAGASRRHSRRPAAGLRAGRGRTASCSQFSDDAAPRRHSSAQRNDSATNAGATQPLYPAPAVASATPSVTRGAAAAPTALTPATPASPAPTFPYPAAPAQVAPTPAAPVPVNPVSRRWRPRLRRPRPRPRRRR